MANPAANALFAKRALIFLRFVPVETSLDAVLLSLDEHLCGRAVFD
jgi:hypothetical protein